ncbi:hypothetical protein TRICI_004712 [Trichomonascus ciferrii]|uniref:Borealin N-terminal domain-containing protein n=1 Tax=Trichomonascus ciferrii TaxID=44093 RepID=A0A642V051_9ASCO|nr:hypothetical protein TRICI_004712 [Trichomonascus ciferrii]
MGQLTVQQRDALVENLRLELGNRLQRLRAQHELAAKALRSKIQMRINRVPKRLWHKSIREITQERTNNGSFTLGELSKVLMKPSMDEQLKVSKVRHTSKSGHSPIKVGLAKQQTSPQKKPAPTKNTVAKPTKATATKKTATTSGKRKKNEDTATTKPPLTKTTANSNKVAKNTTRSVSNSSSSSQRQQQPRRNLRSRTAAS